jgi:uncharacterized protein YgbK (DUF1537 family)
MRCLLIADDLTGACDAAIQFRLRGARTRVALTPDPEPAEVLAFNTETRGLTEPEIRTRIQALAHWQASVIFKKIDSLMRGNPAAEIAAALEAFACDEAIVTPAFPAMGRRVVNGHLVVDTLPEWTPLDVSALARDAETDDHLRQIVREGLASGCRILWAGSGGLACALAEELLGPLQAPAAPPIVTGPVLFCIGSDHPVTLAQQALLRQHGHRVVTEIDPAQPAGAILITGGDTAALVCRALSVQAIDLEGEILTGLPWGRIVGGPFHGTPVATKSGAFGAPDALLRVAAFFGKVEESRC